MGWLLAFSCLLLGTSVLLERFDVTLKVDRLMHDVWVRLGQVAPPPDVVIASIDAESLAELGRWPWPRERQALVLEELAHHGARAVVIDILYVEPEASATGDVRLAAALETLPVSILPVLIEGGGGRVVEERLPLPALTRVVTDLGHLVLPIDDDGLVRRVHLMAGFGRAHWAALPLAALAAIEPDSPTLEALPGGHGSGQGPGNLWTHDREVMVPYVGPNGTFARIPAVRLVRGEVDREEIEGRVVFFGLTAAGLGDLVPTPVSALDQPMSGIEMHANVFAALRDGRLVSLAPPWSGPLAVLLVLPILLLIYSRATPGIALPAALLGACLPIVASLLIYRYARLWFAPLSASLPILASYLLWSRHRLGFVNRFLERERSRLEPHLPRQESSDDAALVAFFEHAGRHLPIAGWRFISQGHRFEGGEPLPSVDEEVSSGHWTARGRVHGRRYRTPGRLRIDLIVTDAARADEITAYVDSLSWIRSRLRPPRTSGTVERLQGNAERLSEQLEWLRGFGTYNETMLAGGPAGFAVWNPAGEWLRGNSLLHRMVPGLADRALLIDFLGAVGHAPCGRGDTDRTRLCRERFDALLLEGRPWQLVHEHGERALVINLSAVGDSLPRRLLCASVIDVSEIRSAERARAELVDYLSHDLRSPLVSALALLGDAERGERTVAGADGATATCPGTAAGAAAPDVARHIRRSLEMMDDLLNVARADALREERFDDLLLDAVLDNALGELRPQAQARGIRLEVDDATEADEELWTSGDGSSLERAFGNLLGNAVKYSPDGATVRVRLYREGEEGVLEIDDDGVGIDPEVLGELFTRFRRDARVAGRIKGTGLGLAFVARVVRQHAGTVEAASAPGRGTCVTLRLPLERAADVRGR